MHTMHLSNPNHQAFGPRVANRCSAQKFANPYCKTLRAVKVGTECKSQEALPAHNVAGVLLVTSALLLGSALPAQARLELPNKEVDNDKSPLVQELLRRSQENRERYQKERLQDYYRRNFKEYFEFEGQNPKVARARGISPETQQAIAKWLEENK